MAKASGVSAAVYGNAAAPAPQQEIHDLMSGVKGCSLRGILFSNNDAFFHGLACTGEQTPEPTPYWPRG
eukprot:16180535-Heterocapsa_arctica.AAC.1